MFQVGTRSLSCAADEELIDTLIAISVVSKRLAKKLALLEVQSQIKEGGKADEQNERDGRYHRRPAQMRYRY